ncbi:hypothetical protein SEA_REDWATTLEHOG_35 [Gordonia phage RedWattleHog]|uniref:Uncharacterized protein n=1 Tax=Gordonia phage Stormageddon TaxID=2656541 RepID=A0A649VSC1_9CAUD|nr:hypothetical protein KHQ86_gp032 [Gordonia phage Stormageddon]QGJ94895.1 hypothetical protein SEA_STORMAGEDDON_32 [Gordonia phage Stormageddon]QLF83539.1 hypothetical protein SEA_REDWATTLEHOG_35 [Gordonia phage RedWattleHog]
MARVDLTEPFAIRNARKAVTESLQAHGEEVIGLAMYHVLTDPKHPRCPNCYDPDYKQADKAGCDICYGTSLQGGVKQMARMWAMFDDSPDIEDITKRGVWNPGNRNVQLEANPHLIEHDYVFRVRRWSRDHRPLELGDAFSLDRVTIMSLRTGNQYTQDDNDRVGQKCQAHLLDTSHVIYKANGRIISPDFPISRSDGLPR